MLPLLAELLQKAGKGGKKASLIWGSEGSKADWFRQGCSVLPPPACVASGKDISASHFPYPGTWVVLGEVAVRVCIPSHSGRPRQEDQKLETSLGNLDPDSKNFFFKRPGM